MTNYNRIIFLTIPAFVYLIFIIFSDTEKIFLNIYFLKWEYFLTFIGFWSLGVVARIVRWHLFMRSITTKIPFRKNILFYLSGFSMLMTPGRVGEIIRSPFIKRDYDISITKTTSLVFVERFYDILSVIIIVGIALVFTDLPKTVLIIPLILISIMILLIFNKKLLIQLITYLRKNKFLKKILPNLDESYEVVFNLFKLKFFLIGIICTLSVVIFEAIGVFYLFKSLEISLDFVLVTAIFHTSNFLAAVSMIPGGFGILEAGLAGLLIVYNISSDIAFSAALLLRIVATGFFSIVGLVCLKKISKTSK